MNAAGNSKTETNNKIHIDGERYSPQNNHLNTNRVKSVSNTLDNITIVQAILQSWNSLKEDEQVNNVYSLSNLTYKYENDYRMLLLASEKTAKEEQDKRPAITKTPGIVQPGATQLETQAMAYFNAMPLLTEYLLDNGYDIRDSSGENNNCLFYSIVQCVYFINNNMTGNIAKKAAELRLAYDQRHPGSEGQGLFFDNNNSHGGDKGHAESIVGLASEMLGENIRVKVISPNSFDDGDLVILEGDYVGHKVVDKPVLNILILNTPNHYQSVFKEISTSRDDPFF